MGLFVDGFGFVDRFANEVFENFVALSAAKKRAHVIVDRAVVNQTVESSWSFVDLFGDFTKVVRKAGEGLDVSLREESIELIS